MAVPPKRTANLSHRPTRFRQRRRKDTKQLHRRAKELGYELKPILHEVVMPDGEVLTVTPDGEIVNA